MNSTPVKPSKPVSEDKPYPHPPIQGKPVYNQPVPKTIVTPTTAPNVVVPLGQGSEVNYLQNPPPESELDAALEAKDDKATVKVLDKELKKDLEEDDDK
jgi:hypothetical protein